MQGEKTDATVERYYLAFAYVLFTDDFFFFFFIENGF